MHEAKCNLSVVGLLCAMAVSLVGLAACYAGQDYTLAVTAFEDLDADGGRDEGERLLPGVLALPDFEGYGRAFPAVSDENGEAAIHVNRQKDAPYSLSLDIISPCGYRPTTATHFSEDQARSITVGFYPELPRQGTTTLRFHIWEDLDSDGAQNGAETDLEAARFGVFLKQEDGTLIGVCDGYTDPLGSFELALGNTCATVWVEAFGDSYGYRKWSTTSISPLKDSIHAGESPSRENVQYQVASGYGVISVEWGWQWDEWIPDEANWVAIRTAALRYVNGTFGEQGFPAEGEEWVSHSYASDVPRGSGWVFTLDDTSVSISTSPTYAVEGRTYYVRVEKGSDHRWEGTVDRTGRILTWSASR